MEKEEQYADCSAVKVKSRKSKALGRRCGLAAPGYRCEEIDVL